MKNSNNHDTRETPNDPKLSDRSPEPPPVPAAARGEGAGSARAKAEAESVTEPVKPGPGAETERQGCGSLQRMVRRSGVGDEIIGQLETLASYYKTVRQVGHTTAILEGTKRTSDAIVVADRHSEAEKLKSAGVKTVTLHTLHLLRGVRAPLVLDNLAAWMLVSGALSEIRRLQEIIKECHE